LPDGDLLEPIGPGRGRRCAMTGHQLTAGLLMVLTSVLLGGCPGLGWYDEPMHWNPADSAAIEGMSSKGEEIGVFRLGAGDKFRITVFGADRMSGVFDVDLGGAVAIPLIGVVPADGKTLDELKDEIVDRLRHQKLIIDPDVSIAMVTARPYYVLGEVGRSGSYPYLPGSNIISAIATAGGFSYRAEERYVFLRRAGSFHEIKVPLNSAIPVNPGDIVRVASRLY
jgi:protein involved in polysaccharide export with SLBB domain